MQKSSKTNYPASRTRGLKPSPLAGEKLGPGERSDIHRIRLTVDLFEKFKPLTAAQKGELVAFAYAHGYQPAPEPGTVPASPAPAPDEEEEEEEN